MSLLIVCLTKSQKISSSSLVFFGFFGKTHVKKTLNAYCLSLNHAPYRTKEKINFKERDMSHGLFNAPVKSDEERVFPTVIFCFGKV